MAFIDTSLVSAKTLTPLQAPTSTFSTPLAIPTFVPGTAVSIPSQTVTATVPQLSGVNATLNKALALEGRANNYITSTIKSALGTFDKQFDSLSSGISDRLSGLFKNKNDPQASTVPTQVSDPVKTNLLAAKRPAATSFRVDSASMGSQAITSSGTRVTNGSGALQMTGVQLNTLINRLRVDVQNIKSIPGLITSRFSAQRLDGLFRNVTTGLGEGIAGSVKDPFLGSFLGTATATALNVTLGVGQNTGTAASLSRKVSSFVGRTTGISNILGGQDLSGYYITNPNYSILDNNYDYVDTGGSGIDADMANSILGLVRNSNCTVSVQEYYSGEDRDSFYGLGLILAALEGMKGLVNDLLLCSNANGPQGQIILGRAFQEAAGSQVGISKSIIDRMDNPVTLGNPDLSISILTNDRLSVDDVSTVDSIFTSLGTTAKKEMSIPSVSSSQYLVYDESWIPRIQPQVLDTIYQNSVMTDYIYGKEMKVGLDGKLIFT